MTWRELRDLVNSIEGDELDHQVPVFEFSAGEMVELNDVAVAPGEYGDHCGDIKNYEGKHYLLAGISLKATT